MQLEPDSAKPSSTQRFSRVVGRLEGEGAGPCVIIVGGLHGNEPAGIEAIRRVCERLRQSDCPFRGDLVGLAGNLTALEAGERYLRIDLNRVWTEERTRAIREGRLAVGDDPEVEEQQSLLAHLDDATARARGPIYFLDLHTSSAPGEPFICFGDTLRNREFAFHFPAPVILGLEETIDGALSEFMTQQGHVSLAVEGGQHDSESSIEHLAATIWIALESAGCIAEGAVDEVEPLRRELGEASDHVPPVLELTSRHAIQSGDDFRMEPGFKNFQRVERGERLATDRGGIIRSPGPCRILLPLYQAVGSDGFFLAREVEPFWLGVSKALRRVRFSRLIHVLPGVEHHPAHRDWLRVNPAVARWYVYELFHLLGYRKQRAEGEMLVVERRAYDLSPPRG